MYALLKAIVIRDKGWLITLCLGVGFSVLTNFPTVRQVSTSYLRDLINRQEVACILIIKNKLAVQDQYMAEITLTPVALKKYEKRGVTLPFLSPHFSTFAGSSGKEVDQWETDIKAGNNQLLSVKKKY